MAYPRGAPKPAAGGGDTTTTVIELSRLGSKDPLCAAPKGDDSNVGGSGNSLGGDGDSDASLSIVQAGRQNPRLAGWTLALSTAIILTGFDINIISNVASLPEFQCVATFTLQSVETIKD